MNGKQMLLAGFVAAVATSTLGCKGDAPKAASTGTDSATVVRWDAPVTVTAATSGGADASFVMSPSGKLSLAWLSATNGGSDAKLYLQHDLRTGLGLTDSAMRNVSVLKDPLANIRIHGEAPPRLAYRNDSVLYAAYLVTKLVRNSKPQNALRFAVSNDGGKTWGASSTVTPGNVFGLYDDPALLVAGNDDVYLSWMTEGAADTARVYFANSANGGKVWSKPRLVDAEPAACGRTSLASGTDGSLYLAWRKRFSGELRDIVVARSTDQGATWGAPARVYADEWQVNYCNDAGPALSVAKNGTLHVVWYTGKLGRAGTQYAQSIDGGKTFSKPVELSLAANSRPSHVQLVLGQNGDDRTVVALWDDGLKPVPQVVLRVSRDGGKTFGRLQEVSALGVQAMFPSGVLRNDTLHVVWQERTMAGFTEDSLVKDKQRDKDDPTANIELIGSQQVMVRRGVLGTMKR